MKIRRSWCYAVYEKFKFLAQDFCHICRQEDLVIPHFLCPEAGSAENRMEVSVRPPAHTKVIINVFETQDMRDKVLPRVKTGPFPWVTDPDQHPGFG